MYIKRKTITTVIVLVIVALLVVGILAGITKGFKDWTFGKGNDDGVQTLVATFDFGEKQTVGPEQQEAGVHSDGTAAKDKIEMKNEDYTLSLTNLTNVYNEAFDKVGNSALKLGTSTAAGSFTLHAPKGVSLIKIYVAGYKTNGTNISVNEGKEMAVETLSDDGEYTVIEIKVPSDCEITFTTCKGGYRAMIDCIEFYA